MTAIVLLRAVPTGRTKAPATSNGKMIRKISKFTEIFLPFIYFP